MIGVARQYLQETLFLLNQPPNIVEEFPHVLLMGSGDVNGKISYRLTGLPDFFHHFSGSFGMNLPQMASQEIS